MRPQSEFWRLGLNQNVVVCWLPMPVFWVVENTRCASTKFTSLLFSPPTAGLGHIDHHLLFSPLSVERDLHLLFSPLSAVKMEFRQTVLSENFVVI